MKIVFAFLSIIFGIHAEFELVEWHWGTKLDENYHLKVGIDLSTNNNSIDIEANLTSDTAKWIIFGLAPGDNIKGADLIVAWLTTTDEGETYSVQPPQQCYISSNWTADNENCSDSVTNGWNDMKLVKYPDPESQNSQGSMGLLLTATRALSGAHNKVEDTIIYLVHAYGDDNVTGLSDISLEKGKVGYYPINLLTRPVIVSSSNINVASPGFVSAIVFCSMITVLNKFWQH